MFIAFFPMDAYLAHLADVADRWADRPTSRHRHVFSKGQFLAWLGTLIHMTVYQLPATEWHWRTPASFPAGVPPPPKLHGVFPEAQWKRYWADLTIPGLGIEESQDEELPGSNS